MLFTYILCVSVLCLLSVFYSQRRRKMRVFKDMGIPGPEPNFLFGNLLSFWKVGFHDKFMEWTKVYGMTFGYFEGPTPILVTSDADTLQQVFVKQFNNFHARKVFPVQVDPDKDENVHMFFARGDRWKRLRSIVNPAFSSAKMRMMSPLISECTDTLLERVKEIPEHQPVAMDKMFQRLTLDTIFHCAFHMDSQALHDPSDRYLQHCKGVIRDTTKRPLLFMLGFIFPTLQALWISIYNFLGYIQFNPVFWLEKKLTEVIDARRSLNQAPVYKDLIQLMLEARMDSGRPQDRPDGDHCSNDPAAPKLIPRKLTNNEIISQSLLFLLAGFETTSTTLSFLFYEMAANPHVQEKLRQEIFQHFPTKEDQPSYDNVRYLKYLDMVMSETLRKYPIASQVMARQCMQTTRVGDYVIPKGMLVQADVWSLHRSRQYWGNDVDDFRPERFDVKANEKPLHPNAWMPFGGGPRTCAGLRFAVLEAKITTIKLLREFAFSLGPGMEQPLRLVEGATIQPAEGVQLTIQSLH